MRLIKYFKTIRLLYRSLSHTVDLPEVNSLDAFLESMKGRLAHQGATQSLDLGCGKTPRNPFLAQTVFGVDIRPDEERHILQADLTQAAIPFDNASMDFISAFDFIEHVPRVVYLPAIRYPFIELMNEIHRVLKPNGLFLSQTPIFPFSACFTDPTHVNPVTSETFSLYFDDTRRWGQMYGFHGAFSVKHQALFGTHLLSVLQKVTNKNNILC